MKKLLTNLIVLLFMALAFDGFAQNKDEGIPFNGIIVDLVGQPVKGARIFTLDKNFASKSDKKGRFGLTNVLPEDTVHVIFRRHRYDIPVNGRKSMRITLGDQVLKDVVEDVDLVDLGYGFVKRRETLTPTNGISGEVLVRTGQHTILSALRGLVPGLNIHNNNQFGVESSVTMRGINSLNLSTTPLFIVDGAVVNSLDYISIYDVETVEVLKDGSIYGSRGANGAIIVHTKRGGRR